MSNLNEYNPYVENGYTDRKDYLRCLAEDYNVDLRIVKELAGILGETEDFDGLVNALEDIEETGEYYGF